MAGPGQTTELAPFVVIAGGPHAGRRVRVSAARTILGRGPSGVDVALQHASVSRQHAVIVQTETGWILEDMESVNGTFVNGKPVFALHSLRHGDRIGVGDLRVCFWFGPPAASTDLSRAQSDPKGRDRCPLPAGVAPMLDVTAGADAGVEYILTHDVTLIGRGNASDLILRDPAIAGTHMVVTYAGDRFVAVALGDHRLTIDDFEATESVPLRHGGTLRVGNTTLRFWEDW